jgi:hypothetical protein
MQRAAQLVIGLLAACVPPSLLSAQAVPSLGAEALVGTGGITSLSPAGTPGVASNPAGIGGSGAWSLGLVLLSAPATDVTEQAFGGELQVGRVGFGLRLASRRVTHLFEDPILTAAGLRVQDTDASLGGSLVLSDQFRLGASALYASSQALGASAAGFGGRLGGELSAEPVILGIYYGTLEPGVTWRVGAGTPSAAQGTSRLAVATSFDGSSASRVLPRMTLELDVDEGERSARWFRASLGWNALDSLLTVLAATAAEVGEVSMPTTYEAAVGVQVGGLFVYLGGRFGAEPAPGNTYALGARVSRPH